MAEMIIQRLVWAVFALVLLALFVRWVRRAIVLFARSASLACPRCAYSLEGLSAGLCPECGWRLSAAGLVATRRLTARPVFAAMTLTGLLVPIFPLMSAGEALLEVNRLIKIGPYAFVPGYTLLDATTDFTDLGIIGAMLAAYVSIVILVTRTRARSVREYRDRLCSLAAELQQKPPSVAASDGIR